MFHYHYVGHFDPHDPVDTSGRPHRPKARRPLGREAADRVLAGFGPEVAEYVWYDDGGYVGCVWAHAPRRLWDDIRRFALALAAAEGAVLMTEPPGWLIEYPEAARRAQEEYRASAAAPGAAADPRRQSGSGGV